MCYVKNLLTFLFIFLAVNTYAQPWDGLRYNNYSYTYNQGMFIEAIGNGQLMILDYMTDEYLGGHSFFSENDAIGVTVVDSNLSAVDTSIIFPDDSSSYYAHFPSQMCFQDDTTYFLLDCMLKNDTGFAPQPLPVNLLFFKMGPNYELSQAKYVFEEDSLGVLFSRDQVTMKYNERLELFELFLIEYDSLSYHTDLILIRLNRSGELVYYKKWDYTVNTPFQAWVSDYEEISPGRYLLSLEVINDLYVFADTAAAEIDTSHVKPDIRELHSVVERDDSYMLLGQADGHSVFTGEDGKAQYVFLELDKQNFQEKNRYIHKLADTLDYDLDIFFTRKPVIPLDDGGYIVASDEIYYPNDLSFPWRVMSIYRMDSMANVIWKYRLPDSVYSETHLLNMITRDPENPNRIWFKTNVWYNSPLSGEPWIMRFHIDGRSFDINEQELEQMESFRLYPNPVKDLFMVLLPFLPDDEVRVNIYTMGGELVQQETFNERDNLLEIATGLKGGNYLVEVSSEQYRASRKLVIRD